MDIDGINLNRELKVERLRRVKPTSKSTDEEKQKGRKFKDLLDDGIDEVELTGDDKEEEKPEGGYPDVVSITSENKPNGLPDAPVYDIQSLKRNAGDSNSSDDPEPEDMESENETDPPAESDTES